MIEIHDIDGKRIHVQPLRIAGIGLLCAWPCNQEWHVVQCGQATDAKEFRAAWEHMAGGQLIDEQGNPLDIWGDGANTEEVSEANAQEAK